MKILVVQTSFLGDTILSTPLFPELKKLHPDAELWVLTTTLAKDLIARDPLVRGVITYDKRGKEAGLFGTLGKAAELRSYGFSKVYCLHRSFRSALLLWLARIPVRKGFRSSKGRFLFTHTVERPKEPHDVERNLALISDELTASPEGELRLTPPSLEDVSSSVRELVSSAEGYGVMVPGSAWHTKMWHWENFRELARMLGERGQKIIVLGSPQEKEVAERVSEGGIARSLAGTTSLAEMLLLIKNARFVVCNDSMSLHVASAFKVPTVAIFCATSPRFGFGPWRNRAKVVEKAELPCKPCSRHGTKKCPITTEDCMRLVRAHEVLRELSALGVGA